jgi:hypothetical protein
VLAQSQPHLQLPSPESLGLSYETIRSRIQAVIGFFGISRYYKLMNRPRLYAAV